MKKYLICLLLFTFCFLLSTLHAQDTLVLSNGQKMGVKVISVTDKIIYSVPPGDNPMYIKASKVSYIKYKDGSVYTLTRNDSVPGRMHLRPYLVISGGAALPLGNGYAGNDDGYANAYNGYFSQYVGFAGTGSVFSATAGIENGHGWELTGMFSYIRNPFNSYQLANEITNIDIDGYTGAQLYTGSVGGGNYYYTNNVFLLGMGKNWEGKNGEIGISLMAGVLQNTIPAMHGTDSSISYENGVYVHQMYMVTLEKESQYNFALQAGIHADIYIWHHIFFRISTEFIFSGTTPGGDYELTNLTTGVSTTGGYAPTSSNSSTRSSFTVFNVSGGIGYKF